MGLAALWAIQETESCFVQTALVWLMKSGLCCSRQGQANYKSCSCCSAARRSTDQFLQKKNLVQKWNKKHFPNFEAVSEVLVELGFTESKITGKNLHDTMSASSVVGMSALSLGGCGFNPQSGHTKPTAESKGLPTHKPNTLSIWDWIWDLDHPMTPKNATTGSQRPLRCDYQWDFTHSSLMCVIPEPYALIALVCVCGTYLEDETLWAGELIVPHGLVHEQQQQAGQEGQHDENQAHNLSSQYIENMSATKLNCP